MAKYHVNSNGEPGVCKAQTSCPFGSLEDDHYSSKEEAQEAYEAKMSDQTITKVQKPLVADSFDADKGRGVIGGQHFRLHTYGDRPGRKTRVYPTDFGTTEELELLSGISESELVNTRRGDDPVMDDKWKQWNKAERSIGKSKALTSLEKAGFKDVKLKFSRSAGCSMCPCSPGFIVADESLKYEGKVISDIFGK